MKKLFIPLVALGAMVAFLVPGAFAQHEQTAKKADVCVLLPDKTSSTRYEQFDRPFLAAAFKRAGVSNTILNALGSTQTQISQGEQCVTNGAKVILVDPLDSGTGAAIEAAAAAKGVKSIDYDRLTLKGKASYYVSFDNVQVGKTMGKGLVAAIAAKHLKKPVVAILNGGITDNNAKLFKQGYDGVLKPFFAKGTYIKAKSGDQWTDWNYVKGHGEPQQDQRRYRGERRPCRLRRGRAQGPGPEGDPRHRTGRNHPGRAVHPGRVAERHGVQEHHHRGQRCCNGGDPDDQGPEGEDERQGLERRSQRAVGAPAADLGHEEELHDPLHHRLLEEVGRVQGRVQEVLLVTQLR